MLQGMQLVRSELAEKMKIIQNEIDILKNESQTKDLALQSEQAHYQNVCNKRDAAREDINKATFKCQLKEGEEL